MVLHDQHCHSCFSYDSDEPFLNMLEEAKKRGCQYFLTTEHLDFDLCNSGTDWIGEYDKIEEIYKQIRSKEKIELLLGIEVGYKKEYLDRINAMLKAHYFDVINLSVHDAEGLDFYFVEFVSKVGPYNFLKLYFEKLELAALNFDNFDVLCHFDYAMKTVRKADSDFDFSAFDDQIKRIFKIVIKKEKVLEINTKVQSEFEGTDHLVHYLKLYKECGGKLLTLSSDAHKVSRYLEGFEKYSKIIKECGFNELSYFVKRQRHSFAI